MVQMEDVGAKQRRLHFLKMHVFVINYIIVIRIMRVFEKKIFFVVWNSIEFSMKRYAKKADNR